MKRQKRIPQFKSEDEEQKFWASHSPLDYVDTSKADIAVFPNLKTSIRTLSIRLPESLVESIKALANKKDIPYQSMLKMLLAEKVREVLETRTRRQKAS